MSPSTLKIHLDIEEGNQLWLFSHKGIVRNEMAKSLNTVKLPKAYTKTRNTNLSTKKTGENRVSTLSLTGPY